MQDPDETREVFIDVADDIDALESLAGQGSPDRERIAALARGLDSDLGSVSGEAVRAELGGGLSAHRRSGAFALGVQATLRGNVGARLDYSDSDRETLRELAEDAEQGRPVDFEEGDLTSRAEGLGVTIGELGVSFARSVMLGGGEYEFGITPKAVQVETIYFDEAVAEADTDDFDADDARTSHTDFNADVGVSRTFANGVSVGAVVRNLIPRDYETVEVNGRREEIRIDPQVRAGIGYEGGWYRGGIDVDLIENEPATFGEGSQYVAIGGELDAWGWLQLRGGYRANLADSDLNSAAVGIGIAPFRTLHVDIAATAGEQEIGGSANLSLTF